MPFMVSPFFTTSSFLYCVSLITIVKIVIVTDGDFSFIEFFVEEENGRGYNYYTEKVVDKLEFDGGNSNGKLWIKR